MTEIKFDIEQTQLMCNMYKSGINIKEISKQFNVSVTPIIRILKNNKIMRTASEAQNRPETKLKKSIANSLAMNKPEIKIRNSKTQKIIQNSKDVREKKSIKQSISIKKVLENPEYHKKLSNIAKIVQNRPERKLQKSISSKERFKNKINHPRWKGGMTPLFTEIRNSDMYNIWRISVFRRDNFTCCDCGYKGNNLEAHHCNKRFTDILRENNISTFEQAILCYDLWNINNGITLCEECHNKKDKHKKLNNIIKPILLLYP